MEHQSPILTTHESQELIIAAGTAFQPRSPINTRELFAGRWEQLTTIVDAISQTGLHIVIFGERGVGKTSLSNIIDPLVFVMEDTISGGKAPRRLVVKINTNSEDDFGTLWRRAFDEVFYVEDKPVMGFNASPIKTRVTFRQTHGINDDPTIDEVRRSLGLLPRSVFIFDEFDRGSPGLKRAFTDLIKALSDYGIDSTVVVVGVSDTVDELVRDHASIVRSVVQIQLPRMTERELAEIIHKASETLKVTFLPDASSLVIRMSQGLPHYTHLIGLHATREAAKRLSRLVSASDVHSAFPKAVEHAVQSCRDKYLRAIHSARKDALYAEVLLACASASATAKDALGYFHPSDVLPRLARILKRTNVTIATFQKHLNELCGENRGPILQREGIPRAFKYRFCDPLVPPFVFMTAVSDGSILSEELKALSDVEDPFLFQ